jgi:carbon-monoxide dehydrogenase medium subunit
MIPASFDYHAPTNVSDALALLARTSNAKVLAGGQSLIPAMRFRLSSPEVIIDLNALAELRYLEDRGSHLAIGALCRERTLETSLVVRSKFPLLFDTARVIADPLVRNQATVGGNLAHADPANDHPATMLAYGATVVARSPKGNREIAIDDFFTGLFETSLKPGELLTEIRVPTPPPKSGGAYLKIERKVGDYATAAVAVQLTMRGDVIAAARVGLTNVNPVPSRAKAAEAELVGKVLGDEVLEKAGRAAAGECDPADDLRGQADYKKDLVRVLIKRAVTVAVKRANGGRS